MEKVRCYGGSADVSDGEYLGNPVAVKRLTMDKGDPEKIFKVPLLNLVYHHHHLCLASTQRLCREIISWKYLSHRNILPLFGVSMPTDPQGFCVLTEWMPNGNIMQYTRSNPEANRFRLVSPLAVSPRFPVTIIQNIQLSEVMSGVAYLHELSIVHGDLKGVSPVLVCLSSPRLTSEPGKYSC